MPNFTLRIFALGAILLVYTCTAQAQKTLTAEDIIDSLQNNAAPGTLSSDDILVRLQNSFRIDEQDPSVELPTQSTATLIEGLPRMDFEIFFDYDSAAIKPDSLPILMEIGKALSDRQLAGSRFVVAGHTDAAGSGTYNARLSKQRAEAVRMFLLQTFPVDASSLVAYGFGEEQLRDPANPEAAINRRVQMVNLGVAQ